MFNVISDGDHFILHLLNSHINRKFDMGTGGWMDGCYFLFSPFKSALLICSLRILIVSIHLLINNSIASAPIK